MTKTLSISDLTNIIKLAFDSVKDPKNGEFNDRELNGWTNQIFFDLGLMEFKQNAKNGATFNIDCDNMVHLLSESKKDIACKCTESLGNNDQQMAKDFLVAYNLYHRVISHLVTEHKGCHLTVKAIVETSFE